MKTLNDYKAEWEGIKYLEGDEAMAAVKADNWNLQNVRIQTPEICLEAVTRDGYALKHILPKFQTPEICLEAMKNEGGALQHAHLQTPEISMEAVKNWGHALQYVHIQTPEICMAAILENVKALQYVQEDMFDRVASELDDILNINGTEYKKISK